jgi:DNA-binding response OmpR family regulator
MATSYRVLVIDNDDSTRQFIKDALEDEGYVVAAITSVPTQPVVDFRPDVILLDLKNIEAIPEQIAIFRRWESAQRIPIVGLSVSRKIANAANTFDIDTFLAKPFDLESLLNCVEDHLPASL